MTTNDQDLMTTNEVRLIPASWYPWIAGLGVLLGLLAASAVDAWLHTPAEPAETSPSTPTAAVRPSDAAAKVVAKHLAHAERAANEGLAPHLEVVDEFFATARARTPAYAAEALGWTSKYKLASDFITGNADHAEYLQSRFEELLFTEEELNGVCEQAMVAYLKYLDDLESRMLVDLEQDLASLPSGELPAGVDAAGLRDLLHGALQQALSASQAEFQGMVGREIVSWICGEVVTMAGVQLAVSCGILSTGAASGWATFGTGVVVGLIVDAIVTEIYRQQYQPEEKLTEAIHQNLSQMSTLILKGTDEVPGLEARLQAYAAERNANRRRAIQQAVLAP